VYEEVIVFTDGGSRGNPGPAAAAFTLTDIHNKLIVARAFFLGKATNNVAEYTALIKALEEAAGLGARRVAIRSDSELMVRQVKGEYKVKNQGLSELYAQAMQLLAGFASWRIEHIYREKNVKADELVNRAIDDQQDITQRPQDKGTPLRIAILLSGSGRTMDNILAHIRQGSFNASIELVVSSRDDVAGVDKAKAAGLGLVVIRRKDYPTLESFSKKIASELIAARIDLVVQAGWLCLWHIPPAFVNRVMNIHPALLPSFGGQGMWGHHVHEAVLRAGCKISGCTVHFCTNEYDKGPIIVQRCCPVAEDDTPDTLAARVFQEECIAYPEAIRLFARRRIVVHDNCVHIKRGDS
jgi:formyltetrahydrofolate-dependent phosphoribosylglycinamide formyltransferase